MLQEWFEIIEAAASSTHAALIISLSLNIALAWGWWRREQGHISRYDQIRGERTQLENTFLERLKEREDEVAAIGREAFAVLQDVAAALAGMERTLDGVEALVHMALDNKLHGGGDGGK
jgi:hypothetical protein